MQEFTVEVECDAVIHSSLKFLRLLNLMSTRADHVEPSGIAVLLHQEVIYDTVFTVVDALGSI